MRIKLGSTWIADSGNLEPSGLRISQVRSTQVTEYIRAEFSGAVPRANWRHNISFQVTRSHANLYDAEVFVLEHPSALPASGTLLMEPQGGTPQRWIADAVLVSVDLVQMIGLTTVWAYVIIGGEVLDADPDA